MGSNCEGTTKTATIKGNILDHHHMTSLMWYHEYLGNFSVSQGVPYVLGETNSISVSPLKHRFLIPHRRLSIILHIFSTSPGDPS